MAQGEDRFPLAMNIERLGLVPLKAPKLTILIVLALAVAAVFGAMRLRVDDSLSQLFRSEDAEFKQYEEVTRRFPSTEYDVLIVAEGQTLLERESIEKLRDLVTDVQLVDGVRGVISLFSARQPPENGQVPAALFPADLPEGQAYKDLTAQVMANEIIRGKLLSEDGTLALVVLSLDPAYLEAKGSSTIIEEIRRTVQGSLAGTQVKGITVRRSVMQLEIRNAVERDRVIYNLVGFLAGSGIAMLFFRRVSFMIVAAGPPLLAILLALGALGWLDFRLNMFLNIMTPLIMVISFRRLHAAHIRSKKPDPRG
jgi:predicted RND superfamily exporter protein